jgi:hypothetical protein
MVCEIIDRSVLEIIIGKPSVYQIQHMQSYLTKNAISSSSHGIIGESGRHTALARHEDVDRKVRLPDA